MFQLFLKAIAQSNMEYIRKVTRPQLYADLSTFLEKLKESNIRVHLENSAKAQTSSAYVTKIYNIYGLPYENKQEEEMYR